VNTADQTAPVGVARSSFKSDLRERLLVAVPAAIVLALILAVGGAPFAVLVCVVAGFAAFEAVRLVREEREYAIAAGALAAAVVAAAAIEGRDALIPALLAAFALLAIGALAKGRSDERVSPALVSTFCIAWVGITLAHGVLLRELEHGGALVLAVLLATFLGDTAAHIFGSIFGRRPLAPTVSPRKTVEGLVAGIIGGTLAVVVLAIVAEPWLEAWQAALFGLAISVAGPAGDLWESAIKREAGVKDSGSLLGAHGGVLDRVDALLFTVPLGYYLATLLV
jgi:CDP-diglyceride synthetase